MSFQAYLDALETKAGRTPRQLLAVGTTGSHRDASTELHLDGIAARANA